MKNILYLSFKIFLKGSKKAIYSLFGIIIGVSVLVFSFSLMDGYREIMEKTLKKIYPPILLKGQGAIEVPSYIKENAKVLKEDFFEGFVISKKENLSKFALVRAMEENKEIVLGMTLAKDLNLKEGDQIIIVYKSNTGQEILNLKVDSIKKFGLSFIDESYLIIPIKFLKNKDISYGIYPKNKNKLKKINKYLKNDPLWYSITFEEITKDILSPLKIVEWSISVVLSLITIVSGFNLFSKLLLDMRERRKTFAVLYALGMKPRGIFFSFFIYSFFLGLLGIILGIFFGYIVIFLSNSLHIFSFSKVLKGVYFVDEIVLKIFPKSLIFVIFLGIFLIFLISLLTYIIIKKIKVVDALRFE